MSSARKERLDIVQSNNLAQAKLDLLLRDFYRKKIKGKPVGNIRQETEAEFDSLVRHYFVESYSEQADKVNDKLKVLPFYDITKEDQTVIDNNIRVITDKFYFKMGEIENRNQGIDNTGLTGVTAISLLAAGVTEKQRLDPLVYMTGIASMAVFGAANLATKTAPKVLIVKAPEKKAVQINETWIWKYLTRNDKDVCDNWERACKPLHGKEFKMLDPNTPNPPYDRHIHCRCTMVLIKR
jgi:cell division protein ZapA (FtsZ GTPase activity inhibitor)